MHPRELLKSDRFSETIVLFAAVVLMITLLLIAGISLRSSGL